MQIVGLGIKSKDFCRGLRVILYRSADVRILYHIFAFSGVGLDIHTKSVTCSDSKKIVGNLSFTVFTCCSSSP